LQEVITQVKKIAENRGFVSEVSKLAKFELEIISKRPIVPLIGHFDAGKTSLINGLVGREIFEAKRMPATSIPQTIRRGPGCVKINMRDGSMKVMEIDDFIKARNEERLPSGLQSIIVEWPGDEIPSNLQILDLPGLESGFKDHDQVVMDCLDSVHAFALVQNITVGTIPGEFAAFANKNIPMGFYLIVILTHVDLKPGAEADTIQSHIKNQLSDLGYDSALIVRTSIKDKSGLTALRNVLSEMDQKAQEILEMSITPRTNSLVASLLGSMRHILSQKDSSAAQIQEDIKRLAREKTEIEGRYTNRIAAGRTNLRAAVNKNLDACQAAILSNVDQLANAVLDGKEKFEAAYINTIEKSIEDHIQPALQVEIDKIIDGMIADLSDASLSAPEIDVTQLRNILVAAKSAINVSGLIKWVKRILKAKKLGNLAKPNPIAALVSVVLDIVADIGIKFITLAVARSKLTHSIKNMKGQLRDTVFSMVDEITNSIEENLKGDLQQQTEALDEGMRIQSKNLSGAKDEYQKFIASVESDVKALEKLKIEISGVS
jgi:predicted GTPase